MGSLHSGGAARALTDTSERLATNKYACLFIKLSFETQVGKRVSNDHQ